MSARAAQFVAEFPKDKNATAAAIRAGFSAKSAASQASRMLRNVNIRRAIDEALAAQEKEAQVSAGMILKELWRLANVDLSQAFDDDGNLLPVKKMPEDVRRAISGIDTEQLWEQGADGRKERTGDVKKVRFWDKTKSLELLGRHLKMFTDKVEQTGPNGEPLYPARQEIEALKHLTPEKLDKLIDGLEKKTNGEIKP